MCFIKCDILRDLVLFVQFIKCEKHPWKSVILSKVAGFYPAALLKVTILHGCFSRFLDCTNSTKLRNAPQIGIGLFPRIYQEHLWEEHEMKISQK